MRETQAALNSIGCPDGRPAGRPDGIAGPRTRSAFAAYLAAAETRLGAGDLGTAHALEELRRTSGKICKPAPASAPAPAAAAAAPLAGASAIHWARMPIPRFT
ncbi:hypothetical protein [Leisingera daeponensis]|uniref:hypothetical protein n=1 Tax=Leisingera daeponensis TaxID=405746 RepID=UPI001C97CDE2|nr:hypothetical protein [Leisingera daeponensis]MBY6055259.1 hypothetical protein [Leisingera daeponensis]